MYFINGKNNDFTTRKHSEKQALANNWITPTGKFFTSSAEVAYRYITSDVNFEEEHRGIDDVLIEYEILLKARRQKESEIQYPNQGLIHKNADSTAKEESKKESCVMLEGTDVLLYPP